MRSRSILFKFPHQITNPLKTTPWRMRFRTKGKGGSE